jgi:hypothetical protein
MGLTDARDTMNISANETQCSAGTSAKPDSRPKKHRAAAGIRISWHVMPTQDVAIDILPAQTSELELAAEYGRPVGNFIEQCLQK